MPIIGPSTLKNRLQVFVKSDNAMFILKALETIKYEGKTIQAAIRWSRCSRIQTHLRTTLQ